MFSGEDPWRLAMSSGDFAAAWRICDGVLARRLAENRRCDHEPRHEQFVWRGEPLEGRRVLVRCYHGLGDTLQFVRFAAPLRRIARSTVFWVQPSLMELVREVNGVDAVLPLHDGTPDVAHDVDIEIMELAHALRVTSDSLAAHVPYLALGPLLARALDQRRARRQHPRVGVAWQAGEWNGSRSLPPAQLKRLVAGQRARFYSLQFGAGSLPPRVGGLACEDIVELARRMTNLDLVIAVDSMVAHLAGAMGLPVWLLLPTSCDWRWMTGRDDTPWYPTMRLFRQPAEGRWDLLIDRVRQELGSLPRRNH
jgi:hypothetical protein